MAVVNGNSRGIRLILGVLAIGVLLSACSAGSFGKRQASLVFVPNFGSDSVSVFTQDGVTGKLRAWEGSPFRTAHQPTASFSNRSKTFLVVSNWGASQLSVYHLDPSAEKIKEVNGSPFSTGVAKPHYVAFHPSGQIFYVAHEATPGAVTGWRIEPESGRLIPVSGSPYPTGDTTTWAEVSPDGRFLVATARVSGEVYIFNIDSESGVLTPVPSSPVRLKSGFGPYAVSFLGSGEKLMIAGIDSSEGLIFDMDSQGSLRLNEVVSKSSVPTQLRSLGSHPSGKFSMVASSEGAQLLTHEEGKKNGWVSYPVKAPNPRAVALDWQGKFAYVSTDRGVLGFELNSSGAPVRELEDSPFPAGIIPLFLSISRPL